MIEDPRHRLDDRARGWLRYIWEKATTPDDWSIAGEPHPWWDRYSTPPLCSLARFDLHETGYVLPVMCDVTPAWREVYTRIADELLGRYTTFWSVIDWVTMIGHDPDADRHPPEWLAYIPEHLRGRYDSPGWTANGIEPWGLQPDPIGSDGNLFFRGFLNLLLCFYRYVAGDDRWLRPFAVTGYQDRCFEWDHHRLVDFMHEQWKERPAGVHCENTKIWPFCLSGAGLGLQLYDGLFAASTHGVFDRWVEYARTHYMGLDRRGGVDWFAFYHDPLERTSLVLRDSLSAYAALCIIPYVLPQNREFATLLYESSIRGLGWDDPRAPLLQLHPDPRWLVIALVVAREIGDRGTEERLRAVAERSFEPRAFGPDGDRFGWWFNLGEEYPRGQLASLMMLSEIGEPGSWARVFTHPNLAKFDQPTVEGVDYPRLGIAQAWNDLDAGALWVETVAATTAARGERTAWRVTGLPDAASVAVQCDGSDFPAWRVVDPGSIELECEVGDRLYRIATGHHGDPSPRPAAALRSSPAVPQRRVYVPASPGGSSCCG
jgi:Linalool dehydratase/isomerase